MLLTLLLDQLGAIGLGEALVALGAYLLVAMVLGAILYSWIRHTRRVKDLHKRGLITSIQRTPEEEWARRGGTCPRARAIRFVPGIAPADCSMVLRYYGAA